MKKATVHIPFEEEKLAAVRLYMEQKGLAFEDEMMGAAEALYGKHVPANVREFIGMRAALSKTSASTNPCRPSSAVGAGRAPGGDLD